MSLVNILVLCHEYPPLGGGGGVGAKQYAEAWAEKGHSVTVITSRIRGLPSCETQNGVNIVRVFAAGVRRRATVPFTAMLFYCVFGVLHILFNLSRYQRYQLVNTHFALPTGLLGLVASRLLRIPNLLTIIGGDIYDPTKKTSPHRSAWLRWINSLVMNSTDALVAISSDTKKRAQQFYAIKQDIAVINYGFIPPDPSLKQQKTRIARDGSKYTLIAVGRLVRRKGFDYLLQAMTMLPADVHLQIVGDGPLEAELKQLVRDNGLDGRVTFLGYKTRSEIFQYLDCADCFVLSSLHEGLGIVVQEAMYAGLPIVATRNGGQVDLVHESRNGFLVDPEDPHMLAKAIYKLYANREMATDIGINNAQDIKFYYMANNAEEYVEIFNSLLAPRVPGGVAKFGVGAQTSADRF